MTVVSNASPLIALARIGHLNRLRQLFELIYISNQVHAEVVIAGRGLPGATAVAAADWIRVASVRDAASVARSMVQNGIGAGEASAVVLAKELNSDLVLMDERRGRRFARECGVRVVGCVGILEELFRRKNDFDLRDAYRRLIDQKIRLNPDMLQNSLKSFGLRPL